jgi:hypothetical protein
MALKYVGCCVDCPSSQSMDLQEMVDRSVQVSYRTLMRRVGREVLASVPMFRNYDWRLRPHDLTMTRDFAVSYHRSWWQGQRCYYVRWSAIEFIFA